jgi:D-glycero-alpha-D-manno-heptose-7-phosphate kinase
MIAARAPLRISFAGGGTDLAAYYERFGGMVLSTAITRACHVAIRPTANDGIVLSSDDYRVTVALPLDRPIALEEPLSLLRAALRWFQDRGFPLPGVRISTNAEAPPGSGLGSSSAMIVALVAALARYLDYPVTPAMLADIACEVEIGLLGRPIGRQDHVAAAMGGLNTLIFTPDGVTIAPLALSRGTERALADHLLLFSTRRTHDSAALLQAQRDATGIDADVTGRLHRIKQLALAAREALLTDDLPGFGDILHEGWQLKRGLAKGVSTEDIDTWYALARDSGAYGGKICGAGGGGFFLFCVPPHRHAVVCARLEQAGLTRFSFALDRHGATASGGLAPLCARSALSEKGSLR